MTREEFNQNFRSAAERSHEKALLLVHNELKLPFSYLVKLNRSYDGHPLAKGEIIPQQTRALGDEVLGPLTQEEAVALLWRDGLVPEWIDITPWQATPYGLVFELYCCGRFAESEPLLYHVKEGYPPFHAPGVWTPPGWELKDGRFDVNWHLKIKLQNVRQ